MVKEWAPWQTKLALLAPVEAEKETFLLSSFAENLLELQQMQQMLPLLTRMYTHTQII